MEHYAKLKNNLNKKIEEEYKNYFTKLKIDDIVREENKGDPEKTKANMSYIESLMYQRIKYQFEKKTPPYHSYKPMNEEEKNIYGPLLRDHIHYIDRIIDLISARSKYIDPDYKSKIRIDNNFIYLHKLKFTLDDRIRFLLKYSRDMLKKNNKKLSLAKKLVTRCLLRYSGLGITGQHCSLSNEIYTYLYDKLNIKGEGFSSILNSKLIEKENTTICTVFRDTDKYFKSIGPMRPNIILRNNEFNWTLNPPFFTSIVKLAIKNIISALFRSETKIILILTIPLTKIERSSQESIFNKYLYGYINQTHIEIVSKYIEKKKIERKNKKQYFNCNGEWSKSFTDLYIFFYTNDFHERLDLEKHMITISDLWGQKGVDEQQSFFREPIHII